MAPVVGYDEEPEVEEDEEQDEEEVDSMTDAGAPQPSEEEPEEEEQETEDETEAKDLELAHYCEMRMNLMSPPFRVWFLKHCLKEEHESS